MRQTVVPLAIMLILAACGADQPEIRGCEPVGEIRPVCNMQTPEDIAALPDGRHLLLAHFGGMHDARGSLGLFDTETEALKPLYPAGSAGADAADPAWGDAGCQAPEEFSPHGTHLHQLLDGRWRYLVVNHGGRESVELFELLGTGADSTLAWRGCVLAAPDTFINDVVGLPGGDLIFTRMFHRGGLLENLQSLVGFNTGDLWRWNREKGLWVLPDTGARQPNGLEISADGRYVFANMYIDKRVWKVDAETGEVVATAAVAHADNSAWGSDGRLWVVTHTGGILQTAACFRRQERPCSAPFEIIAVDPDSMVTESVFTHSGAPMGAATIAVPQGGRVYMGSFVGDRLISVPDFSEPE
jgi:hypothetical protein